VHFFARSDENNQKSIFAHKNSIIFEFELELVAELSFSFFNDVALINRRFPSLMSREAFARNGSKRTINYDDEDRGSDEDPEPTQQKKSRRVKSKQTQDEDDEEEHVADVQDNSGMEAGQICRVYVEDFMCHRKFDVTFNRHLNFVNGQNGSGMLLFPPIPSVRVLNRLLCVQASLQLLPLSSCVSEPQQGPLVEVPIWVP
jgi:hypothetical protein